MGLQGLQGLTVCPQEVVEQLEEREAVPALRGLDLQSCIHVSSIKGQEVLRVLHHEVCPPRKRLQTQRGGRQQVNKERAGGVHP